MGATFSRLKIWIAGETLTSSDLNAEFDNILNNLDPSGIDDESNNLTAFQATADPYPGGSESLPTNLAGEIWRLRYQFKEVLGTAQWYSDAPINLTTLANYTAEHNTDGTHKDINASSITTTGNITSGGTITGTIVADGLTINNSLVFSDAVMPRFSVAKVSAAQSISPSTYTKITWDASIYNKNNDFDFTNDRFVCSVAGEYSFKGSVLLLSVPGGYTFIIALYKNGSIHKIFRYASGTTSDYSAPFAADLTLAAGDYVEVYVFHTYTSAINVYNDSRYTFFTGHRVG